MASAKSHVHSRRCLRGPALFLALWAVLLCSAPAPAADQTNPAGNTITANPGMEATADGDRLTNLGAIKATDSAATVVGMGSFDWAHPHSGLILTNNGAITATVTTGGTRALGMFGGDNSVLANTGSVTATGGDYAHGMRGLNHAALSNAGTITATATSEAYGMYGMESATLTNSGTIAAIATNGLAYGMYGMGSATLTNSGIITATGTGASGMYGNGDYVGLTNNGTITASATGNRGEAYGMNADGDNSSLTNSGTITASATTGYAYGMFAYGAHSSLDNTKTITATTTTGNAYGMFAYGANSTLANTGTITASATGNGGHAYGMEGANNSTLANSGTITASATTGEAYGMFGDNYSTLANSGAITASATDHNGQAYGMYGATNSSLANSGTITAIVTTSSASGMYGLANSSLANSGTISASATTGAAYGMLGDGANSTLFNNGTITASATGDNGYAFGMFANGNNSSLTNTGTIAAGATGGNGWAYGMALYSGTVANYGLIRVSAPDPANAWEVYGLSGDPTSTVRITNWATDLRDFTTYKFFGSQGGTLDLDGSRLTLRPGAPERGFAWGREYAVSDLAGGLANGWGRGAVASVTQEVPWVRARLTGTDWTDQKLSLQPNFTRKTNPGQNAASQGIALILNQVRGMEHGIDGQRSQNSGTAPAAVADSGPAAFPTASAPESGWSGFLTPYFSYVDNSDLDYDAKIAGFMAGATRRFNDAFAAGIHLGFSHADVSADLADQDGDTLTGLFGLHGIYNLTPEWYLRGQLTGFISRASNDWESGLPVYPLYTDADINSRGVYASLATGYDWRVNASNTITPEIGLSWLWSHQDSYSLNWEDRFGNHLDNYDLDYKAQDYNALYGTAMVRWRGSFDLAGGSFQPALGVGVRQTLTDGDVKSRLTTAGSSFSTKATEDETTALAEAGFVWQRGITSVGLTYTGGYGDDQVVHTGWLTLKLEF